MSTAASKRVPIPTVLPKPCLKRDMTIGPKEYSPPKHAHFPPPSEEARRYSGIEYDRTPIIVLANELALPERGCPGRTFDDLDAHHYRHHRHHKSRSSGAADEGGSTNRNRATLPLCPTWPLSAPMTGAGLPTIYGETSDLDDDSNSSATDGGRLSLKAATPVPRGPKRLKKTSRSGRHAPADGVDSDASPTSSFASCPGTNSCLGGF
ncbi:hypothetical protein FRC17_003671 [Serendipita sp. 399]|nr:hypothetical protein FRC17_003671 [Serendipita sp. 399]